jgi:hypothetical protein
MFSSCCFTLKLESVCITTLQSSGVANELPVKRPVLTAAAHNAALSLIPKLSASLLKLSGTRVDTAVACRHSKSPSWLLPHVPAVLLTPSAELAAVAAATPLELLLLPLLLVVLSALLLLLLDCCLPRLAALDAVAASVASVAPAAVAAAAF